MDHANELTRRDLVRFGAGMLAAAGAVRWGGATAAGAAVKRLPIGLQLYSVRRECQQDFAGTVAKVAEMGYDGVEFAGYYSWPAEKIRKLLDRHGLKCCGTHAQLPSLLGDEFARTVEFNETIGNKYLIVPAIPGNMRPDSKPAWVLFAKLMTEIAGKAKQHGMLAGYHNHAGEFQPMNGDVPWEVFASNSGKDVVLQVDIGHVLRAGVDPAPHMQRYPGRLQTVHVKDFAKDKDPLVGEGDVDWPAMFRICEGDGGTEWFIIEDESANDPLGRVERDLQNLRRLQREFHA